MMPETTGLVAWEDLKVGETYWLVSYHSLDHVEVSEIGKKGFYDERNAWWDMSECSLYASCADACDAMIARLQAFKAEQGEGND